MLSMFSLIQMPFRARDRLCPRLAMHRYANGVVGRDGLATGGGLRRGVDREFVYTSLWPETW